MSFLARFGGLTEELVSLITATSPKDDPQRFNVYRESALRSLRHHSYLRTNQFLVEDNLRGLDERLRVHNRERLADALKERLHSLSQVSDKTTPDVLHFLLELSDQPTEKTRLTDLDALREPDEVPGPKWSWEDIAREDGWDRERSLWRNVAFSDSSDDDASDAAGSEISLATEDTAPSSAEAKYSRTVQDIRVKYEETSWLDRVRDSQSWRFATPPAERMGKSARTEVTEFQVVREVLFMLGWLPTTLFKPDCSPRPGFQLTNVSLDVSNGLITSFAECGRRLLPLRKFVHGTQQSPLVRAFQDAIRRRLNSLDRSLSELQSRFIPSQHQVVVSLISVFDEVSRLADPLYALANIVLQLQDENRSPPFRYLELIFDAAIAAQSAGQDAIYQLLGTIFFECFEFYLRPIRCWMEEGRLMSGDQALFLAENAEEVQLSNLWRDKFTLVRDYDGVLHAPRFLQPAAKRIFATGKSVVVLQHLGRFEAEKRSWSATEPPLTFGAVCPPELELAPFSELFAERFDAWIRSKHHTAAATLQRLLFETCGLSSALSGLEQVYFLSNGFLASNFSSAVFKHLDNLDPIWKDRFTLTELVQETYADLPNVHRLSVTIEAEGLLHSTMAARSSVRDGLSAIRMNYQLPWVLALIIQEETLAGYQRIFTFLLQLSRAMRCLEKYKALLDVGSAWTDEQRLYCNVRNKLQWFTSTLYSYLTTVVLAPGAAQLQESLTVAVDIDDMIAVHTAFMKVVLSEACLNPKLGPIQDCMLDVLDLAIRLEQSRASEAVRKEESEAIHASNSLMSSQRRDETDEEEQPLPAVSLEPGKSYAAALEEIRGDLDRHLRFICTGLRAVARATLDTASTKWDMLAEMLETGVVEQRW